MELTGDSTALSKGISCRMALRRVGMSWPSACITWVPAALATEVDGKLASPSTAHTEKTQIEGFYSTHYLHWIPDNLNYVTTAPMLIKGFPLTTTTTWCLYCVEDIFFFFYPAFTTLKMCCNGDSLRPASARGKWSCLVATAALSTYSLTRIARPRVQTRATLLSCCRSVTR